MCCWRGKISIDIELVFRKNLRDCENDYRAELSDDEDVNIAKILKETYYTPAARFPNKEQVLKEKVGIAVNREDIVLRNLKQMRKQVLLHKKDSQMSVC